MVRGVANGPGRGACGGPAAGGCRDGDGFRVGAAGAGAGGPGIRSARAALERRSPGGRPGSGGGLPGGRAAADGEVSVAQTIAGRGVVPSIVHGDLRTTYEPVRASVRVGEQVHAGDALGTLQAGHCAAGCLHFGLKRGSSTSTRWTTAPRCGCCRPPQWPWPGDSRLNVLRLWRPARSSRPGLGCCSTRSTDGSAPRSGAASTRSSTCGECTRAWTCTRRAAHRSGPRRTVWCSPTVSTRPAVIGC